jgi:hypothetical protein
VKQTKGTLSIEPWQGKDAVFLFLQCWALTNLTSTESQNSTYWVSPIIPKLTLPVCPHCHCLGWGPHYLCPRQQNNFLTEPLQQYSMVFPNPKLILGSRKPQDFNMDCVTLCNLTHLSGPLPAMPKDCAYNFLRRQQALFCSFVFYRMLSICPRLCLYFSFCK